MSLFSGLLLTALDARDENRESLLLRTVLTSKEHTFISFREKLDKEFYLLDPAIQSGITQSLEKCREDSTPSSIAAMLLHRNIFSQNFTASPFNFEKIGSNIDPFCWEFKSKNSDHNFYHQVFSVPNEFATPESLAAIRFFLQELNSIEHYYRFSVFFRKWLPSRFEPLIVKRALENWFTRLDSEPHGGQYAEYRDGGVHVEFCILGKKPQRSNNMVAFHIAPLDTDAILEYFQMSIENTMEGYYGSKTNDTPIILTCFSPYPLRIHANRLYDFFYGKPKRSFDWETMNSKKEILRDFSEVYAPAAFNTELGECLAGIIIADSLTISSDPLSMNVRFLKNPWCKLELPPDLLCNYTMFTPLLGTLPEENILRWKNVNNLSLSL